MRVGILFGGASREREISYAGGRTVYDLLDRQKFRPIPIFLDFSHRMVRLQPRFLYYGMISDFFPPASLLPKGVRFPLYAEQVFYPDSSSYMQALTQLGPILPLENVAEEMDIAFLVLHGLGGEDGSIQGLLEQLGVPYVGTGIASSAWGIDKVKQREWLTRYGFPAPEYVVIPRSLLWSDREAMVSLVADKVGFPCVIKHPWQGSTIGVAICTSPHEVPEAIMRCGFTWPVRWLPEQPSAQLMELIEGLGLPMAYRDREGEVRELITDWQELEHFLRRRPQYGFVEAWDSPPYLLVERFIHGEEFSVIVIEMPNGEKLALPPTHIRKARELYDYRAKYLSGVSSKNTPSPDLPNAQIQREAERLAEAASIQVYARLDGIATPDGRIFFNDPNTTSGMLPASLLFHQAAEVGFAPKDFLTYLIERSLQIARTGPGRGFVRRHRLSLHQPVHSTRAECQRIAVIFGGNSSERHISLESGRNVVEKLSAIYDVLPLFLNVRGDDLELWELPPRLLFKDNADDVAASLGEDSIPPEVQAVKGKLEKHALYGLNIHSTYSAHNLPWEDLKERVDFVFLALHGRPGEDGTVQQRLETLGVPYNGSPPEVCALLMDKYATQVHLRAGGFKVPKHYRVDKNAWDRSPQKVIEAIELHFGGYPLIAKPVDEGCSTGVRVMNNAQELYLYLEALFRTDEHVPDQARETLRLALDEPFPRKSEALIEEYLHGADWVEVTIGVITHSTAEGKRYQAFLPSETVKETGVLRLEEKFLAGAGQNVTPARLYPDDPRANEKALRAVQDTAEAIARYLGIHGYARIDGFVRVLGAGNVEFWTIEVNTLPGLTPATVFFHQAALAGYTPVEILQHIITEGRRA
ncbi:MAG: D-alanine--D-alanine ligase [Bacteroidia bacterium]|nr:D-alanine--D-alanine ligase [Bacteroidia bacterium]MDW8416267.1 D-alanine--D-alanine ligase [Bacteroidia bacterium]